MKLFCNPIWRLSLACRLLAYASAEIRILQQDPAVECGYNCKADIVIDETPVISSRRKVFAEGAAA